MKKTGAKALFAAASATARERSAIPERISLTDQAEARSTMARSSCIRRTPTARTTNAPTSKAAASPTSAKSKTPYGQDAFAVRTGCICRVDRH